MKTIIKFLFWNGKTDVDIFCEDFKKDPEKMKWLKETEVKLKNQLLYQYTDTEEYKKKN